MLIYTHIITVFTICPDVFIDFSLLRNGIVELMAVIFFTFLLHFEIKTN